MSVAAVLMVKDEVDIIESTVRHLLEHTDFVIVSDNLSTDGTRDILEQLAGESGRMLVVDDDVFAYYQADKTTALAARARELGYDWVIPCDADEMWVADDGRRIGDWLYAIPPDVPAVAARIFHYMPTAIDPPASEVPNPFARIGWRLSGASSLPKVCVRAVPGLTIDPGNHGVKIDGVPPALVAGGLRVNHYSWRSTEQYAHKIVNGARVYAATNLDESIGPHWRMWGDPYAEDLPERAADHFRRYFWAPAPPCAPGSSDPRGMTYDPAIVA